VENDTSEQHPPPGEDIVRHGRTEEAIDLYENRIMETVVPVKPCPPVSILARPSVGSIIQAVGTIASSARRGEVCGGVHGDQQTIRVVCMAYRQYACRFWLDGAGTNASEDRMNHGHVCWTERERHALGTTTGKKSTRRQGSRGVRMGDCLSYLRSRASALLFRPPRVEGGRGRGNHSSPLCRLVACIKFLGQTSVSQLHPQV
jgi:hypothetical protein